MKKVLILDDDPELCAVMKDMFLAIGASQCVCATSLEELQARSEEALRCDVAILDVNLGARHPNGIDAYRWLLSVGFPGDVVFFTGHARSHPLVQGALKYEGVRILEKPAPIRELEELLK